MAENVDNYTVGRGELYFARFAPGTLNATGYRYLGNTPEFSMTLESENLDHYSSDRGIREKDASVTIEVSRSLSIVADEITAANLSMFFFGQYETTTVAGGGSAVTETLTDVALNHSYPLGVDDDNPTGVLKAVFPGTGGTLFKVTNSGATTTYAPVDDYVYSQDTGLITITNDGAIAEGDDIKVTYTEAAYSHTSIVSGAEPVSGALKYVTRNPIGSQFVYTLPYVTIRPNGDFNLKGDDWQSIPFSGEILRKGTLEAVYINGVPA